MTRKLKYLMVIPGKTIPNEIKECLEEQPHRSGLYNWIFAFQGNYGTYWEYENDLEKFDVVQINMSPKDMIIVPTLRRKLKGSSTKLVLNNDYVCEKWGDWGLNPHYYKDIQRLGDMVFSTESHQVSNMIDGTATLPHPSNTEILKHLGTSQSEDSVGFIYHWWAGQSYIPYLNIERVKEKHKVAKSAVFGYSMSKLNQMHKWVGAMFDEEVPLLDFPTFAQRIMAEKCIYDPNPFHTYGRNGVELACFKRPVVGSNRVFSYNKLFPELTCDPYDRHDTMKKFDLAFSSKVDAILDKAYEEVEYFNYKNSKERYLAALDEATDRGGYEWFQKQR